MDGGESCAFPTQVNAPTKNLKEDLGDEGSSELNLLQEEPVPKKEILAQMKRDKLARDKDQVSEEFDVSPDTAEEALEKLYDEGKLEKKEAERKGFYNFIGRGNG